MLHHVAWAGEEEVVKRVLALPGLQPGVKNCHGPVARRSLHHRDAQFGRQCHKLMSFVPGYHWNSEQLWLGVA